MIQIEMERPNGLGLNRSAEGAVDSSRWVGGPCALHNNFKKSSTLSRACFRICASVERLTGRCAGTLIFRYDYLEYFPPYRLL